VLKRLLHFRPERSLLLCCHAAFAVRHTMCFSSHSVFARPLFSWVIRWSGTQHDQDFKRCDTMVQTKRSTPKHVFCSRIFLSELQPPAFTFFYNFVLFTKKRTSALAFF
jgi:hypothetical protein